MSTSVIVPAAGSGVRLGENRPKAFVDLGGHSILWHTVVSICAYSAGDWFDLDRIIVVVRREGEPLARGAIVVAANRRLSAVTMD